MYGPDELSPPHEVLPHNKLLQSTVVLRAMALHDEARCVRQSSTLNPRRDPWRPEIALLMPDRSMPP